MPAITDGKLYRTYPWADRHSTGTLRYKNIYAYSFGYTETSKKVSAGTATAILASIASTTSAQTITAGITNPDVPRALSVTIGGTATSVQTCSVIITGTNVEGKTFTESFVVTIGTTGIINGVKAFKTVTSVLFPAQIDTTVTLTVGTQNILGINHRLFKNNTTVKVYTIDSVSNNNTTADLTLEGVPTVVASEAQIELNTVAPATTPDGTEFLIICYTFDNWALLPKNDQPEYSTTTSTSSTSSSTSTTTITTSTSSTSISTSSTSVSTSSTSSSTSSTSTSTTTAP